MVVAVSNQNSRIKATRVLARDRSARQRERAFVIEGAKVLDVALEADVAVRHVIVGTDVIDRFADTIERLEARDIEVLVVDGPTVEQLTSTRAPQGILAVVEGGVCDLGALKDATIDAGFVVVAEDLNDPGNAGTLIRSAVAAGADAVVLAGSSVDATNPKTVRASAGAIFWLPVIAEDDVAGALGRLAELGYVLIGAAGDAEVTCDRFDLSGPVALVLGSEAHGLSGTARARLDAVVSIPMAGRTESLNVSVAGSILAYEALRQRRAALP